MTTLRYLFPGDGWLDLPPHPGNETHDSHEPEDFTANCACGKPVEDPRKQPDSEGDKIGDSEDDRIGDSEDDKMGDSEGDKKNCATVTGLEDD